MTSTISMISMISAFSQLWTAFHLSPDRIIFALCHRLPSLVQPSEHPSARRSRPRNLCRWIRTLSELPSPPALALHKGKLLRGSNLASHQQVNFGNSWDSLSNNLSIGLFNQRATLLPYLSSLASNSYLMTNQSLWVLLYYNFRPVQLPFQCSLFL